MQSSNSKQRIFCLSQPNDIKTFFSKQNIIYTYIFHFTERSRSTSGSCWCCWRFLWCEHDISVRGWSTRTSRRTGKHWSIWLQGNIHFISNTLHYTFILKPDIKSKQLLQELEKKKSYTKILKFISTIIDLSLLILSVAYQPSNFKS